MSWRRTTTAPPKFVLNPNSDVKNAALCRHRRMLDGGADPLGPGSSFFRHAHSLVLGDPEQLPPVKGAGFFTDAQPDFMLSEVHRQAAENPIIKHVDGCPRRASGLRPRPVW